MITSTPYSLMREFSFFKKYSLRKALEELGPNDPKLNMKMAESLLTISAECFIKKWNFDPIAMKPQKGNIVWTPVKADIHVQIAKPVEQMETTTENALSRLSEPENASPEEAMQKVDNYARLKVSRRIVALNKVNVRSKSCFKSTKRPCMASVKRQCKITEYGRQRKRLNGCPKSSEATETPMQESLQG